MLCSLLFSATIIIGCIKYESNVFADAIQIDSSNERSTSLQSDDPVAGDDDSSEDECSFFSSFMATRKFFQLHS